MSDTLFVNGVTLTDADWFNDLNRLHYTILGDPASFGTGVAAWLVTPSSANLATAITDETGSGALVFGTSPAITTSLTTGSTTFALINTTATTVNFAGAATTLNVGAGAASTATLAFTTAINLNTAAIVSNQTTVAVINTNATTVNAFGAATTLNIGAATGTLTVANTTLAAKAGTFSTTLVVTGLINTAAGWQVTGSTTPASGVGLEAGHNGTTGHIYSYNRTSPAYMAMELDGLTLKLNQNSGGAITLHGAVTADSTLAVTGGLLDISGASAGQIKFPASQNASADANTLDDYEEGTWTPALAFGGASVGITYTAQAGLYTKIGRAVISTFTISITSNGSSTGNATITGITPASSGVVSVTFACAGPTFSGTFIGTLNGSTITLYSHTEAGAANALTDTNIVDATTIYGTMVYTV